MLQTVSTPYSQTVKYKISCESFLNTPENYKYINLTIKSIFYSHLK